VIEMTGLVVAAKLAQRCLVQVKHDIAQLVGWGITGGKTLPVNLAQRADGGGAVLVADFTILLAVVEDLPYSCRSLPCVDAKHPPPGRNGNRALQPGQGGPVMNSRQSGHQLDILQPAREYHLRLLASVMNQCTFRELVRQVLL
jgi:hypothetical protein